MISCAISYNIKNQLQLNDELKKISEYAGNNRTGRFLHIKDNYAVFLFADDIGNFLLLKELDKKITERIEKS